MPQWLDTVCKVVGGTVDGFNDLMSNIFKKDEFIPEVIEKEPHVAFSGPGSFIYNITVEIPSDAQDYIKDGIQDWGKLVTDGLSASTASTLKNIKKFISPFSFFKNFESTMNSIAAMVPKTRLEIDENISKLLIDNNFETKFVSDSYTVVDAGTSYRITCYLTCYETSPGKYSAAILEVKEKVTSKFLGLGVDYTPESITITNIYNANKVISMT